MHAEVRGQLSELVLSFHISLGTGGWLWVRLGKHGPDWLNHLTDSARILFKFGESGDSGGAVVWGGWFFTAEEITCHFTLYQRQGKAVFLPAIDHLSSCSFPF